MAGSGLAFIQATEGSRNTVSPERWFRKLRSPEFRFIAAKGYPHGPAGEEQNSALGQCLWGTWWVPVIVQGEDSERTNTAPFQGLRERQEAPAAHRNSNYKYDKLSKRRARWDERD